MKGSIVLISIVAAGFLYIEPVQADSCSISCADGSSCSISTNTHVKALAGAIAGKKSEDLALVDKIELVISAAKQDPGAVPNLHVYVDEIRKAQLRGDSVAVEVALEEIAQAINTRDGMRLPHLPGVDLKDTRQVSCTCTSNGPSQATCDYY